MKYLEPYYLGRSGHRGRIPVGASARSPGPARCDVAVGERLYGFWPMSSDALLTIGRATPAALTETSPHRRELAPVYNSYVRVAADPRMPPGSEPTCRSSGRCSTTSFLIDDFLAESGFFGADTVLITSASSKTSIGLAYCLSQRGRGGRRSSGSRPKAMPRSSPGSARMTAS